MKVKVLAILLVAAIAASLLGGCTIIRKNEERDLKQVMVEVNYGGLSSEVTKADIIEAYNSYGYYYTMYYGYTVEETVDMLVDSLANRQLLLLYAKCELAKNANLNANVDLEKLLSDAEIDKAVKDTNKTMQSWYDNAVKELESEAIAEDEKNVKDDEKDKKPKDDGEKDGEKEKTLEPRPVRPADAEPEFNPEAEVSEISKKFFDDGYDRGHNDSEFKTKAVAQLKKDMKENFRDYDYYLNKNLENMLLQRWQRKLSEGFTPDENLIAAEYQRYIKVNKETYEADKGESYGKDLKDNIAKTVYHPKKGFGYVYNILLQFSDEQKALLEEFAAAGTVGEDTLKAYREQLAEQIKVNVSNPDYNPEYKDCADCKAHAEDNSKPECDNPNCPAKAYVRKDVPVNEILGEIYDSFEAISNDAELNGFQKFVKLREEAAKWTYKVNDDKGMFDAKNVSGIAGGGNGYLITPEGEKSDYVEEFTALGREMIAKGLGTYTTAGDDESRETRIKGMYCVTEFGIHVMFVSNVPYNENAVDKNGAAITVENGLLPLDYVVSYGRYGSETTLDKTLRDIITENLTAAHEADVYSQISQKVVNDNSAKSIVKNDRKIKKIVDALSERK